MVCIGWWARYLQKTLASHQLLVDKSFVLIKKRITGGFFIWIDKTTQGTLALDLVKIFLFWRGDRPKILCALRWVSLMINKLFYYRRVCMYCGHSLSGYWWFFIVVKRFFFLAFRTTLLGTSKLMTLFLKKSSWFLLYTSICTYCYFMSHVIWDPR